MSAVYHPAFIGADCAAYMSFETRVRWYAIWIKAYPLSSIHFRHMAEDGKKVLKSFIVAQSSSWCNS